MNNTVILDSEIKQAKNLKLEDIEGNLLNNKKLIIDAGGLSTGLRKMRDGHTFFGTVAEHVIHINLNFLEKLCHKRRYHRAYQRKRSEDSTAFCDLLRQKFTKIFFKEHK